MARWYRFERNLREQRCAYVRHISDCTLLDPGINYQDVEDWERQRLEISGLAKRIHNVDWRYNVFQHDHILRITYDGICEAELDEAKRTEHDELTKLIENFPDQVMTWGHNLIFSEAAALAASPGRYLKIVEVPDAY